MSQINKIKNILFKKNKKIFFLEDFSLINSNYIKKNYISINGFFVKNASHRNFLIKETYNYSLKLINLIKQDLRYNYKLNYKLKHLNRFLLPWAILYVTFFYSIYKKSKELKKKKYQLIIQNYNFKHQKIDLKSYQSFNLYYLAWKDIFYFSKEKNKTEYKLFFKAYNLRYNILDRVKYYLSKISIFLGKIFHKKIVLIDLNLEKKDLLKLIVKSHFKYCYFFLKEKNFKDLTIQSLNNTIKSNDNFLNILIRHYKKYIFSNYMNILFEKKINPSQDILLTNHMFSSDSIYRDFFLKSINLDVYGIQHGGNYCVDQYNLPEIVEKKISKKFISWGKSNNKNKISLPKKKIKNNFLKEKSIFYVSTAPDRCLLRFDKSIYPQFVKNTYFKDHQQIISKLSKHKYKIIVRLDRNDNWLYNRYFKKKIKFKNMIIDDENSKFTNKLEQSSINLFDYLGTTYLKSFLLNKPTIIYCNKKFLFIKKNKMKYFNRLKKMSIFFDDINKLTLFLNSLNNEHTIHKWWYDKKLQLLMKDFHKEFIYNSESWDNEMIKKFN